MILLSGCASGRVNIRQEMLAEVRIQIERR